MLTVTGNYVLRLLTVTLSPSIDYVTTLYGFEVKVV